LPNSGDAPVSVQNELETAVRQQLGENATIAVVYKQGWFSLTPSSKSIDIVSALARQMSASSRAAWGPSPPDPFLLDLPVLDQTSRYDWLILVAMPSGESWTVYRKPLLSQSGP